jgi:hypothetical protein
VGYLQEEAQNEPEHCEALDNPIKGYERCQNLRDRDVTERKSSFKSWLIFVL